VATAINDTQNLHSQTSENCKVASRYFPSLSRLIRCYAANRREHYHHLCRLLVALMTILALLLPSSSSSHTRTPFQRRRTRRRERREKTNQIRQAEETAHSKRPRWCWDNKSEMEIAVIKFLIIFMVLVVSGKDDDNIGL
jgi:hypothetical protein